MACRVPGFIFGVLCAAYRQGGLVAVGSQILAFYVIIADRVIAGIKKYIHVKTKFAKNREKSYLRDIKKVFTVKVIFNSKPADIYNILRTWIFFHDVPDI